MKAVFLSFLIVGSTFGAELGATSTAPPVPFSRELDTLTIREFELFREAQVKLEDEREKRAALALLAVQRLIEAQIGALEATDKARSLASDKALEIANIKTEKHLESLNGEQARLAADRERFISREAYEATQKEFGVWRDQVNAALSIGAGRDRGIGLSWGVVIGFIGAAVAIASMIMAMRRRP